MVGALARESPPSDVPRPEARPPGADAGDVMRQLGSLYAEHHAFVWRNLLRMGVPEHAVADAVHDTFLVVARRLAEFRGQAALKTWLFAIVLRVAQSRRRDGFRDHRRAVALKSVSSPPAEPGDPHARLDAARTLHAMLLELPEDQRAVFVLAEMEEMSAPEIAALLKVKLPTVYSRLRLAREKMKALAAADEGAP
jgi:RNA polymerase sigma-70 factor (ECF subfamily)